MPVSPETLRLVAFLGGLFLFLLLETFFAKRPWETPRGKRLLFHGGLAVFNTVLLRLVAAGPFLAWAGFVEARGWGLVPWLGLRGIPAIVVSLILLDGLDYLWHRASHQFGFLWRFHKVHHVDTHVDVSTALRFHSGELLISAVVKAVWVLLIGPSLVTFALFEALTSMAAQFHHGNYDFPDGVERVLRLLTMTPRRHTAHHTVTPRSREANFATIFAFWDKLFGSWAEPDTEEMKKLGLPRGRETCLEPWETLKGPFVSDY